MGIILFHIGYTLVLDRINLLYIPHYLNGSIYIDTRSVLDTKWMWITLFHIGLILLLYINTYIYIPDYTSLKDQQFISLPYLYQITNMRIILFHIGYTLVLDRFNLLYIPHQLNGSTIYIDTRSVLNNKYEDHPISYWLHIGSR